MNPDDTLQPIDGWRLQYSAPDRFATPDELDNENVLTGVPVPGTVAMVMPAYRAAGILAPDQFDACDWWYRCEFAADPDGGVVHLCFDGLATLADVWLNGQQVLFSDNMFRRYRVDVSQQLAAHNSLAIVFRSLTQSLAARRPRPRWKTNLVEHQQLRWFRTTLLGRIPSWTPPLAPVGPWRTIRLERATGPALAEAAIACGSCGQDGWLHIDLQLDAPGSAPAIDSASLYLDDMPLPLEHRWTGKYLTVKGDLTVPNVRHWWPHTHGEPQLYRYRIVLNGGSDEYPVKAGQLGFRQARFDRTDNRVELILNDKVVFARGGCWTTNDPVSLDGCKNRLRRTLETVKASGANMIRIGGTMVYESDEFYELCDELGLMVWQDFMFANMDYPTANSEFLTNVTAEITGQIRRLQTHPCIVAWCGNSEVEQQAAMFGANAESQHNSLFYKYIPELLQTAGTDLAYFPSSPCEGALPFHCRDGISHYFGVGAYKMSLDTLPQHDVKFATECLAFSNVPSTATLKRHFGTPVPVTHSPAWKAGVPRDSAAGWDFEDIRDHYANLLFGIDAVALRYADLQRYMALSRVITGEVMSLSYGHWRSYNSCCGGALLWFLNDIVPGAGWGFIDSDGYPKPLYYFLQRCWAPITLHILDRQLDGYNAVVRNESNNALHATLEFTLLASSRTPIAQATLAVTIEAETERHFSFDEHFERFYDVAYRYRFGPPKHDVVLATLTQSSAANPIVAATFPNSYSLFSVDDCNIVISVVNNGSEKIVSIESDVFLQFVQLEARGYAFDVNYFHIAPGHSISVHATPTSGESGQLRGFLSAMNLRSGRTF